MEQKKILWILFSVTIFLLVAVGTGFVLFFPRGENTAHDPETGAPDGSVSAFDPVEWVRSGDAEYPGLREPEEGESGENGSDDEFVIVYGETDGGDGALETEVPVVAKDARPESGSAGAEVRSAPMPDAPAPEPVKPRPVTRKVQVTEYWIQAGSFQSRSGAEEANRLLSEKGFTGRLTTKEVDDSSYYRVRIGPYSKKEEAEKFLAWVKEVEQFDSSYISQVSVTKTITE